MTTVTAHITMASRVKHINAAFTDINRTYHPHIPLEEIFTAVRAHGFEPLQEDGTPWSGLLLGRSGRMTVDLRDNISEKVTRWLTLTWYKMGITGRFEVIAYVS